MQHITTIMIKTRDDMEEFVRRRGTWFESSKDNPVLASVSTFPHHTSDSPRIRAAFYRRHPWNGGSRSRFSKR